MAHDNNKAALSDSDPFPRLSKVLQRAAFGEGGGDDPKSLASFPQLSIHAEQRQALLAHIRATAAAAAVENGGVSDGEQSIADGTARNGRPSTGSQSPGAGASGRGPSSAGSDGGGDGLRALPVDWVVDIADTSNDWFFGTAVSYDDIANTVHVMVPDAATPVWEGDIELHSQALHMVECHDGRTVALFKQLVRDSALAVDWLVDCPPPPLSPPPAALAASAAAAAAVTTGGEVSAEGGSAAAAASIGAAAGNGAGGAAPAKEEEAAAAAAAGADYIDPLAAAFSVEKRRPVRTRARLFLPMGCYALVEAGDGDGRGGDTGGNDGNDGSGKGRSGSELRLIDMDQRVKLLSCNCDGPAADAFYQLAADAIVDFDEAAVDWRAHKAAAAATAAAAAAAAASSATSGDCIGRRNPAVKLEGRSSGSSNSRSLPPGRANSGGSFSGGGGSKGKGTPAAICEEMRTVLASTLDFRDVAAAAQREMYARLRRFVLDGDLAAGEWLYDSLSDAAAKDAAAAGLEARDAAARRVEALEESMLAALEAAVAEAAKPKSAAADTAKAGQEAGGASSRGGGGDRAASSSSVEREALLSQREALRAELDRLLVTHIDLRQSQGLDGAGTDDVYRGSGGSRGNGAGDGATKGSGTTESSRSDGRRSSGGGGGGKDSSTGALLPRLFRIPGRAARGGSNGGGGASGFDGQNSIGGEDGGGDVTGAESATPQDGLSPHSLPEKRSGEHTPTGSGGGVNLAATPSGGGGGGGSSGTQQQQRGGPQRKPSVLRGLFKRRGSDSAA